MGINWSYTTMDEEPLLEPNRSTCNGYLDHPFKNKHLETDQVLPPLLANTGELVYNPRVVIATSCSNDDTLT